ncbi:hypothetical protein [Photobacterium kishitanii]|uniref:hypothetical protein n=1 Tax=Photobacterium kishitanii TaxID=318456 RepID=UPI0007F90F8F|nr:hypothetical protein [Photobacterium kishitanii]OBU32026.1 hypothetical protein AYY23_02590 [Photobacterium kishitanii]PSW47065.1 hypothetical protein C0W66_20115 [Photobacterium kishitanii]
MLATHPFGSKQEVDSFLSVISGYYPETQDINLLSNIFKLTFLFKVMVVQKSDLCHKKHINGIIYDSMNSIISIVNLKERYLQLNIRSLVEHISRISLDKSYSGGDFDGCVRRKDFEFLKKEKPSENWGYIHNVYIRACHYVHLSPESKINIHASFLELLENDFTTKASKQIKNLQKIISEIMKIFISYYYKDIAEIFHRSQGELRFLLGKTLYNHYLSLRV